MVDRMPRKKTRRNDCRFWNQQLESMQKDVLQIRGDIWSDCTMSEDYNLVRQVNQASIHDK